MTRKADDLTYTGFRTLIHFPTNFSPPHLDYGMTACLPGSVADKMLEAVQSKATAMVFCLKD